MLRIPLIASIITSIWRAAPSRLSNFNASGHLVTTMLSPSWGKCCQICSVTNGMNGCNNSSIWRKIVTSKYWTVRRSRSLPSLYKRGLANSIYQSQYVFQMKSYTELAASPSSNLSRLDVTLCTVSLYFWTIHWSANVKSSAVGTKLSS